MKITCYWANIYKATLFASLFGPGFKVRDELITDGSQGIAIESGKFSYLLRCQGGKAT